MTTHCCRCRESKEIGRNGRTRHSKHSYKCRDCGRQFVLDPVWKAITPEQYGLIELLLLERICLAGIARVLQISEEPLQRYVNAKAESVPEQVQVSAKPKKPLTVQLDQFCSFVDRKHQQQ